MIEAPQLLINYLGGSCGEWLAIKMAQHDKYYNPNSKFNVYPNNRWRIRPSWRSAMLDTDWKTEVWSKGNMDYDGTQHWWDNFWKSVPDTEYYYEQVRELHAQPDTSMGVHRVHEGWVDQYWRDLFADFKTVTISVNQEDTDSQDLFVTNVIKKIMWQDLTDTKLTQEVEDKCRKYSVDYPTVMSKLQSMPDVKWIDAMLVVLSEIPHIKTVFEENIEEGVNHVYRNLSSRYSKKNTSVYSHRIPGGLTVDFGRLLVKQSYDEYLKICEYTGAEPWKQAFWIKAVQDYTAPDLESKNTINKDTLKERLWERAIMITS